MCGTVGRSAQPRSLRLFGKSLSTAQLLELHVVRRTGSGLGQTYLHAWKGPPFCQNFDDDCSLLGRQDFTGSLCLLSPKTHYDIIRILQKTLYHSYCLILLDVAFGGLERLEREKGSLSLKSA